jgi:segregation and condensation protein B
MASTRRALEALIFASDGPATAAMIRRALPELTPARIPDLVSEINEELAAQQRPYEIVEAAGGYQFRTLPEFGETIRAAQPERKVRLSRPALETLAVVAYRQPLTRGEIEELRSVDCGAVTKSLLERGLVRIVGRRDTPGRPALYATTSHFLEVFGLKSLQDLPTLRDFETLDIGTAAAGSSGLLEAGDSEDDSSPGPDNPWSEAKNGDPHGEADAERH